GPDRSGQSSGDKARGGASGGADRARGHRQHGGVLGFGGIADGHRACVSGGQRRDDFVNARPPSAELGRRPRRVRCRVRASASSNSSTRGASAPSPSGGRSHTRSVNSNGIPRSLDFFSRGTGSSNPSPSSRQSVSLPPPLLKVENPAFHAGLGSWLGDRVSRDSRWANWIFGDAADDIGAG